MRFAWLGVGVVFAVSGLAGSGCSTSKVEPSERTGSSAQAIQNGTVDTTSSFAVGVCSGGGALGSRCNGGICSGALILPNVVATARHCVDNSPARIDCTQNPSFGARKSGFRVTTNPNMNAAQTGWYSVSSVAVPDDDHICGNDIALLVLSQAIPAAVARPIVPGVQYLMWDPDQYVSAFVGIGYGNTSPNGGGSGTRRRSKLISVLCVPGSDTRPCPASLNPKEFVGGDGTCSGDSGSSAYEFALWETGSLLSFGVLSRGGESDDGTTCEGSVYTRFDAHRDFVLSVAKSASNNWTSYPEPSWTAYKPPPTPKPKDAGADGAPTTAPSGLGLGASCEKHSDCASKLCADNGDEALVCSKACDEASASSCPEGYECRDSLCLAPLPEVPAEPGATTTTTTKGCATGQTSSGLPGALTAALGAAVVLGAVRRRRR
ncbi:MAG: trypsin-like serine protease [Labilithrix sp.]|nr:trypsin-like serine protease [Labilithrix sp.]